MADIAASTKLGVAFGPLNNGSCKAVIVGFATTDTADVLIFDASNVGKENALSKIVWANIITATGGLLSTMIASNQLTVGSANISAGATNVTVFAIGVAG